MTKRQKVYDTYWKIAAERQNIFFKKLEKSPTPYTDDFIFRKYKFCNVYRASDRVSQYLIKNVIYNDEYSAKDTLFRIFLFRLLNKNETWGALENRLDSISLKNFTFKTYSEALENIKRTNKTLYGNAFILCANKMFGYHKKHLNHLALLEYVFKKTKIANDLEDSNSLQCLFNTLRTLPLIGDFMAYQLAVDFNYSEVFNFNENDFTIAGPGAIRGIKKCFINLDGKSNGYVIKYMVDNQEKEFERLNLDFKNLYGRPMHAIDCQGWFCETDKYTRVRFPELKSNRVRIKSQYKPSLREINYYYPPKWNIN